MQRLVFFFCPLTKVSEVYEYLKHFVNNNCKRQVNSEVRYIISVCFWNMVLTSWANTVSRKWSFFPYRNTAQTSMLDSWKKEKDGKKILLRLDRKQCGLWKNNGKNAPPPPQPNQTGKKIPIWNMCYKM